MTRLIVFVLAVAGVASVSAQRPKPKSAAAKAAARRDAPQPNQTKPAEPSTANSVSGVSGNIYRNAQFGFAIEFPETWTIADRTFEADMRAGGIDLSLKAPRDLAPQSRISLDRALKNVTIVLTAFRPPTSESKGAILRISTEDLSAVPQVKDAVDYFDLMRSQYKAMRLPRDFKYSETNAEKLGTRHFAFIDTSSTAGQKRMYATVKRRHAIVVTLAYTDANDLETVRRILADGNFYIR